MTTSPTLVWSPIPSASQEISQKSRSTAAFTLMEILIVLAILGLLVGLSVTKLGGVLDGARINTAKIFINDSMKAPLFTYKMQTGDFPTTEESLQALLVAPANKADRWQGPYHLILGVSRTCIVFQVPTIKVVTICGPRDQIRSMEMKMI